MVHVHKPVASFAGRRTPTLSRDGLTVEMAICKPGARTPHGTNFLLYARSA
jgi:hypothetical protein